MLTVKSVDDAIKIIKDNFAGYSLGTEIICIHEALGRIAAGNISAVDDIPGFNRSTVDGYAVVAADTYGCSDSMPAQLKYAGEIEMGYPVVKALEKGQAVYVPTGGGIPPGADSVVMIEYTDNPGDGYIYVNKPAAPGNNIIYKGDDIKAGNTVINSDVKLRAQEVGVLAAMGIGSVFVKKRIKVGIISTGDEIVDIDRKPEGTQVRDINSYTLYTGLIAYGAEPVSYGIVRDDYTEIQNLVEKALAACDIVLISGGSSAGIKDETLQIINSFGDPGVLVHGIAVKPGKPTIIGKVCGKAVIGLPGHPASAFVIFKIIVHKLLDTLNGLNNDMQSSIKATAAVNYPSNNGREEFLPVRLEYSDNEVYAHPVFGKSGLISLLASADGYIRINRLSEGLSKGEEAEVILF